jgi:hypothetical protein
MPTSPPLRLLEVECEFTDDYLIGHARGSVWPGTDAAGDLDKLLPTIRYDVKFESDRLREAGFERIPPHPPKCE